MHDVAKPLNRRLLMLREEARRVHGAGSLVFNQVMNAVNDFGAELTIWEAYDGAKRFAGAHRTPGFERRFNKWMSAHDALASQDAADVAGLSAAAARAKKSTQVAHAPLYRIVAGR